MSAQNDELIAIKLLVDPVCSAHECRQLLLDYFDTKEKSKYIGPGKGQNQATVRVGKQIQTRS